MANLANLVREVAASCPGATDLSVLRAVRTATTEILKQSQAWQQTLDPIVLQDGVTSYDMGAPSGTQVERILTFNYAGRSDAGWSYEAARDIALVPPSHGANFYGIDVVTNELVIGRPPASDDVGSSINLYVVLVTTRTATTIPDPLMNDLFQGIIEYAKAEMMALHPRMPWADAKQATIHRQVADDIAVRAKRKQATGNHVHMRVRPRPFC